MTLFTPRSSSPSAQNRPAGPMPTMIGRCCRRALHRLRGWAAAAPPAHVRGQRVGGCFPGPAPPPPCRCSGGCSSCARRAPSAPPARWPGRPGDAQLLGRPLGEQRFGSSSHSARLLTRNATPRALRTSRRHRRVRGVLGVTTASHPPRQGA